jgi:hypothetical protein
VTDRVRNERDERLRVAQPHVGPLAQLMEELGHLADRRGSGRRRHWGSTALRDALLLLLVLLQLLLVLLVLDHQLLLLSGCAWRVQSQELPGRTK